MMRRLVWGLVSTAMLFGVACKRETPEEAAQAKLAPLRPAAAARIAALEKLVPTLRSAPKLTTDAVAVPAGTIKFDAPEAGYNPVTAGLIYEANLENVRAYHNKDQQPMDKAGLFGACAALLDGTGFTSDHNQPQVLQNCANARYVVMVRTTKRVKPEVNEAEKTFVPGEHEGEILVFDLDTGKALGGFRFAEKNDDTVKTRGISGPAEIDAALSSKVQNAITEGLTKYAAP